jgi:hypothetical protein
MLSDTFLDDATGNVNFYFHIGELILSECAYFAFNILGQPEIF